MRNRLWITMVIAASGCANQLEEIPDNGGGNNDVMPQYVADAFGRACGQPGVCHNASGTPPAMTPTAAPGLVGAASLTSSLPLVDPGNLLGSYVAIKLLPDELIGDAMRLGTQMPQPGSMYDPADVTLILGWIASTPPTGAGNGGSGSGGDGMTAGGMTAGTGAGTGGGGPMLHSCAPSDIAPGTTPTIEFADEAGKMPSQIGMMIQADCGCHLVDSTMLAPGVAPPPGLTDLGHLAGIQANIPGIQLRLVDSLTAMPPPTYCEPKDVQALSQTDFDTLNAWLAAGAPDGATWMGGGGSGESGGSGGSGGTGGTGGTGG